MDCKEVGKTVTPAMIGRMLDLVKPDYVQCDCKGHPGYTSWPTKIGSTSPGVVNDALRIHRDVTRELGLPLVVHYSGVWDNRAVELHPDWACVGPDGEPNNKGWITGSTCNLSPYTDELMIPQMLEIIDNYDIDGFWVDGENWATLPCWCDRCTTAFTHETGITAIPQSPEEPHWRAWADCHRQVFEAHVRKYTEAIHARKPSCLVCSNWMYTMGQPHEIRVPVDYLSGDFAWKWGTEGSIREGRYMDGLGLSWNLMAWGFSTGDEEMGGWTFKSAPHLCQEAATVMSLGGAIQIYDNPQRNGHLTDWHQDILAEVARFARARQPWCQGTQTVPQVAVLHSAAHLDANRGGNLMTMSANYPHGGVVGALHALLDNHCQVDILNEQGLAERISEYPLVVIADQTCLPDSLKAVIATYVQNGGKLILAGANVATDFAELAGVTPRGEKQDGHIYLPVGHESTAVKGPWQPVALAGARTVIPVLSQQEPGRNDTDTPAVTLHQVGAGAVLAIHTALLTHYGLTHYPRSRKLVGELLQLLQPNFLVEMEASAHLHLVLRRQQNRLIAHLVNMGASYPTAPASTFIDEVPTLGPITLRIQSPERPTRVFLAPSMEGLSWEWRDGVITARVASAGIMDSLVIEAK